MSMHYNMSSQSCVINVSHDESVEKQQAINGTVCKHSSSLLWSDKPLSTCRL